MDKKVLDEINGNIARATAKLSEIDDAIKRARIAGIPIEAIMTRRVELATKINRMKRAFGV